MQPTGARGCRGGVLAARAAAGRGGLVERAAKRLDLAFPDIFSAEGLRFPSPAYSVTCLRSGRLAEDGERNAGAAKPASPGRESARAGAAKKPLPGSFSAVISVRADACKNRAVRS